MPWAELLQRVFEVDALRYPRCGTQMRLLAAIEDPEVARKILGCLGLPHAGRRSEPRQANRSTSTTTPWNEESLWDFDREPPGG